MKEHSIKMLKTALVAIPLVLSCLSLPLLLQADILRTENIVFGGDESLYEVRIEDDTSYYPMPTELTKSQSEPFVKFVTEEMVSKLQYELPEDTATTATGYSNGTMDIFGISALDNRQYFFATLKNVDMTNGKAEIKKINVDWIEGGFRPFAEQAEAAFRESLGMVIPADYTVLNSICLTDKNTVELAVSWQNKREAERGYETEGLYFEEYQALLTDVDLTAGTGAIRELRNIGGRNRNPDTEIQFTNSQKGFLLDTVKKFAEKNGLKIGALEGIADAALLDISGSEILDIVYRNDDTTRTIITITINGKIKGYRNSVFYTGGSYLLTQETKALFDDLAKTELKNILNVSLTEKTSFDYARLDPQNKSLTVSTSSLQSRSSNEYTVTFNHINLDMGTGNVLRASADVSDDSTIQEVIKPLKSMIIDEFENQLGITIPSGYEAGDINLSFRANEAFLGLHWVDRSSQSDILYEAGLNSVDIVNATGNFTQLGMQIRYANYSDTLQFTEAAVEKMIESARSFATGQKLRTGIVAGTIGFEYESYSGLAVTFAPEPPMELLTTICVTEDGRILSYQTNPAGSRTVPISVTPK